jgi:hypothetical protein
MCTGCRWSSTMPVHVWTEGMFMYFWPLWALVYRIIFTKKKGTNSTITTATHILIFYEHYTHMIQWEPDVNARAIMHAYAYICGLRFGFFFCFFFRAVWTGFWAFDNNCLHCYSIVWLSDSNITFSRSYSSSFFHFKDQSHRHAWLDVEWVSGTGKNGFGQCVGKRVHVWHNQANKLLNFSDTAPLDFIMIGWIYLWRQHRFDFLISATSKINWRTRMDGVVPPGIVQLSFSSPIGKHLQTCSERRFPTCMHA